MLTMLRKTYAKLGRLAYKAVRPFLRFYMTNKHLRVRILLVNELGEILLVRSWLGHQKWSLPGGGIQRKETPKAAAVRELLEETGLQLSQARVLELGAFTNPYKESPYTVVCFTAKIKKQDPTLSYHRRLEVLDTGWFSRKQLPKDCSLTVKKALNLHRAP